MYATSELYSKTYLMLSYLSPLSSWVTTTYHLGFILSGQHDIHREIREALLCPVTSDQVYAFFCTIVTPFDRLEVRNLLKR